MTTYSRAQLDHYRIPSVGLDALDEMLGYQFQIGRLVREAKFRHEVTADGEPRQSYN